MTVQELIDALMEVDNKSKSVVVDCDFGDGSGAEYTPEEIREYMEDVTIYLELP